MRSRNCSRLLLDQPPIWYAHHARLQPQPSKVWYLVATSTLTSVAPAAATTFGLPPAPMLPPPPAPPPPLDVAPPAPPPPFAVTPPVARPPPARAPPVAASTLAPPPPESPPMAASIPRP